MLTMEELLKYTEIEFAEVYQLGMMSDDSKKEQIDMFLWEHLNLPVSPIDLDYWWPDRRGVRIDSRCSNCKVKSHVSDGCKIHPHHLSTYKKTVKKLEESGIDFSSSFITVYRVCQNRFDESLCRVKDGSIMCSEMNHKGEISRPGMKLVVSVSGFSVTHFCTFDRSY